jgi:hypothetical protein
MKFNFTSGIRIVVFTYAVFCAACLKQNAYAAPIETNSSDSVITIKALRKLHVMGNVEQVNNTAVIIANIVANDEHDNVYKSLIIQDSTGGIVLLLDGTSLYQTYPVGAQLKLHVKDLYLSDYRRMLQLAASIDTSSGLLVTTGIPVPLFSKYITIIQDHVTITPLHVAPKNLGDSLQGRLISIGEVEFAAADTAQTYADKKNKLGISRSLKFCAGGTIYLRTSGYADFAGIKTPVGNGQVIGVYSVYNTEKQLLIRDTSDILLTGKRCTGAAWLQKLP